MSDAGSAVAPASSLNLAVLVFGVLLMWLGLRDYDWFAWLLWTPRRTIWRTRKETTREEDEADRWTKRMWAFVLGFGLVLWQLACLVTWVRQVSTSTPPDRAAQTQGPRSVSAEDAAKQRAANDATRAETEARVRAFSNQQAVRPSPPDTSTTSAVPPVRPRLRGGTFADVRTGAEATGTKGVTPAEDRVPAAADFKADAEARGLVFVEASTDSGRVYHEPTCAVVTMRMQRLDRKAAIEDRFTPAWDCHRPK